MKKYTLIYNARLVDSDVDIKNGAVLICNDKIEGFPGKDAVKKMLSDNSVLKYDAKGCTVMPGFIDMHAHFRDPGLTAKEDIESGSRSAAAGGFGTLVLMPNTKPVVSSKEMAVINNNRAKAFGFADVIQSVSITENFDGKTISHLNELDAKTVPVITEDGKEVCNSAVMLEAMKIAARKKIIVSCHCEDPFLADAARPFRQNALSLLNKEKVSAAEKKAAVENLKQANALLALAEDTATYRNISLAREAKCHIHLCHVSTENSISAVREAKKRGVNVTCEITPHHLGLSGEKSPEIFNIVNPPLREEKSRLECIKALKDGTADVIATDHAPHTKEDKLAGSPGFSGLETAFALCNTVLVKENKFSLKKLSALMSGNAALILGLKDKGFLKEGFKADFAIVDLNEVWTVKGEKFASKGKFTPLEGKKLTGKVKASFFNGKLVFSDFGFSNNL